MKTNSFHAAGERGGDTTGMGHRWKRLAMNGRHIAIRYGQSSLALPRRRDSTNRAAYKFVTMTRIRLSPKP